MLNSLVRLTTDFEISIDGINSRCRWHPSPVPTGSQTGHICSLKFGLHPSPLNQGPKKQPSVFLLSCRTMTRHLPNLFMHLFKTFRQSPSAFSSAIPPRIDPSLLVEEENSPYYEPAYFYPARIGELLIDRYQIATKLGHGSRSTVWLARDLHQFVLAPSHSKVHIDNSDGAGRTSDM
jgi:hypothetical protein